MGKKARRKALGQMQDSVPPVIDCACLIHDTLYDWTYVDKLFNSLCRNLTPTVRMHVYTESNRQVPSHMIHHALTEWPGVRGPKQSWWYKIQLFNDEFHKGHLLYFDLDTVITKNIDWIWKCKPTCFWAVKDFKHLFRPRKTTINSSVMWFDVSKYSYIYKNFDSGAVRKKQMRFHGDQDYIHHEIPFDQLRYFDSARIKSWKWEVKDGGFDFGKRRYQNPESGTLIDDMTSVLVFHGDPKPHHVTDKDVVVHWQ